MVGQAHLLLGDVEFLEVEDHLLLEAVAVHLDREFREVVQNPCADRLGAGLLEGLDLPLVVFDQIDAAQQVGDEDLTLLPAEFVEAVAGLLNGREQSGMLLFRDVFGLGRYHVGQPQDRVCCCGVPLPGVGFEPCARAVWRSSAA